MGAPVPPVLPIVRATVQSEEHVEVTLDGRMWVTGPIDRSSLGLVLGTIIADQGCPVRVEIIEPDGRRFADIITPVALSRFAPPQPGIAAGATAEPPESAPLRELDGSGFIPGEDVGLAVIVSASSADHSGRARASIDAANLPPGLGVLLFGFISGTIVHEGIRS